MFPDGFVSFNVQTGTAFFEVYDPVSGQVGVAPVVLELGPEHAGLIPKTRRTFTRPSTRKTVTLTPASREENTMALPTNWQNATDCPYQAAYWADVQKLMLAQPDLAEKKARLIARERDEKRFSAAFHWNGNSQRVRRAIEAEQFADPLAGERTWHQRVSAKLAQPYSAWRMS